MQNMLQNDLNAVQEELVGLLQEEAAEFIQELSKVRRTGLAFKRRGKDVTNQHHLQRELIDLLILIAMATEAGLFDEDFDADSYTEEKLERLKIWTNLPHSLLENT